MLELNQCIVKRDRELFRVDQLVLEKGKFYALIGANGLGKSSLLHVISSGKIEQGSISFNDQNWLRLSSSERSRQLAWIDNHFSGLDHLSTQEFLELGRYPYTGFSGRLSEVDKNIVTRYAHQLNISNLLFQSSKTLSDGERQRAGIARALIQETPMVLLDEPTSFLDYPTKRSVMEHLRHATQKDQKMILMASHDLEICLEYCTDFLIIDPITKQLIQFDSTLTFEKLIEFAFGKNIY